MPKEYSVSQIGSRTEIKLKQIFFFNKLKHWLKQELRRQKVTRIRKKNKRNVQKKRTDVSKGFGGKTEKKKKRESCQQHPVFPGGHPSKY